MWYEVTRDIAIGSELLTTPKVPFQTGDNIDMQDDRSDRETGKWLFLNSKMSILFYFSIYHKDKIIINQIVNKKKK